MGFIYLSVRLFWFLCHILHSLCGVFDLRLKIFIRALNPTVELSADCIVDLFRFSWFLDRFWSQSDSPLLIRITRKDHISPQSFQERGLPGWSCFVRAVTSNIKSQVCDFMNSHGKATRHFPATGPVLVGRSSEWIVCISWLNSNLSPFQFPRVAPRESVLVLLLDSRALPGN